MLIASPRVFTATMSSGGTLTSSADLGSSHHYNYLHIPTMTSNTQIHIQVCDTSTGTFRRVYFASSNLATPTNNPFGISSAATNCVVPIPNGFRFMKIETTATVDDGASFKIYCAE